MKQFALNQVILNSIMTAIGMIIGGLFTAALLTPIQQPGIDYQKLENLIQQSITIELSKLVAEFNNRNTGALATGDNTLEQMTASSNDDGFYDYSQDEQLEQWHLSNDLLNQAISSNMWGQAELNTFSNTFNKLTKEQQVTLMTNFTAAVNRQELSPEDLDHFLQMQFPN